MKYKLLKKGWTLNLGLIDEGYLWCDYHVLAENRNQAKSKMIHSVKYEGMILSSTEEELSYMNVPIVRDKSIDVFDFEGQSLALYEIEEILKERKRRSLMNEILQNPSITHVYIKKEGWFYCKNYRGYTERGFSAGLYEKQKAYDHCTGCQKLKMIPCSPEEHNNSIDEEISRLELIFNEKKAYYLKGKA
jgi:hypothetical protein